MKRAAYLFFWWFLKAAVVGPFATLEQCEKAMEKVSGRVEIPCWSDGVKE